MICGSSRKHCYDMFRFAKFPGHIFKVYQVKIIENISIFFYFHCKRLGKFNGGTINPRYKDYLY